VVWEHYRDFYQRQTPSTAACFLLYYFNAASTKAFYDQMNINSSFKLEQVAIGTIEKMLKLTNANKAAQYKNLTIHIYLVQIWPPDFDESAHYPPKGHIIRSI
jgi:hypothetical protein